MNILSIHPLSTNPKEAAKERKKNDGLSFETVTNNFKNTQIKKKSTKFSFDDGNDDIMRMLIRIMMFFLDDIIN